LPASQPSPAQPDSALFCGANQRDPVRVFLVAHPGLAGPQRSPNCNHQSASDGLKLFFLIRAVTRTSPPYTGHRTQTPRHSTVPRYSVHTPAIQLSPYRDPFSCHISGSPHQNHHTANSAIRIHKRGLGHVLRYVHGRSRVIPSDQLPHLETSQTCDMQPTTHDCLQTLHQLVPRRASSD
jgi:hypothetical protein